MTLRPYDKRVITFMIAMIFCQLLGAIGLVIYLILAAI